MTNKVLGTALVCLLMASTLSILPGTVNAARLGADHRPPTHTLASPAGQGKIAFQRSVDGSYEIAVINPDGSGLASLSQQAWGPAWSPDGTKIAFASQRDGNEEIYVMNADGTGITRITDSPEWEIDPAWSPDSTKIAFARVPPLWQQPADVWIMNADGSGQVQLTDHPDEDRMPSWSPDGTKIAFVSYRGGYQDIWVMNADGSEKTNLINDSDWDFGDNEPAWSPDGGKIAFAADREKRGGRDIYVMAPDGSNIARLTTPIGENHSPSWSPDGTRIAFASNRDGNYEIYIMNADGTSETRVTTDPVNESGPSWGIAVDTGVIEEEPDIRTPIGSTNFGNVTIGSSLDKTTTIYNDGSTTLTINSITRTAGGSDFTYISPSTPFNVGAGSSQTITIGFAPNSEGSKSAIFNINSNDPDEANVTFNVSGSGVTQTGTIEVTSDPPGASFTLSGPANYSGITPWSEIDAPVGTYTITWAPISSYQTPSQESKTLTQGGTISFYGPYQSGKGTIEVTSDPPGASFTLSGPANYSGITPWSKTDAPVGTYTITWAPISGYQTPAQESKVLTQDGTISFYGPYQSSKGTIEVTSDPSGASFTLSGLANYSGITPWSKTDAPVGTYTITWAPISGYQTPSQESKTLTQGGTISFHGPYQLGKGTIEVASDPSGASFTLSGPANYSGITLWSKTDAPVGTYTVTWGFMSGYETPSQETKTLIQGGMVSFYSRYTAMEAFPGANAVTLWDYYSAWGKEWPPLGERAKMYEALGLGSADSYAGTAEQNTRLLNALKQRQICPSTGEEVGWVAPTTTIAQLIEQETMERIPVTVDGQQYFIVTLTRRIDVNSLEIVPGSSATKVYVDAQGNPVSNRDLAQKIGVIDSSRRWAEGAGSASNIFQNIDGMRSRWAIHRQIKWLGFSLELLPATAAISVRAYFTTGASIPEDILSTASKMFLAHASNPGWVLENIALGNFSEAEEEYRKAMELAGSTGGPRDYKTASAYFKHLFNAYANDYSAWQLLNQIDRIDKKTLEELADLGGRFSAGLVGMNYGLFETLMDSLRALPLTSSYFGIWDQWRSNYENIVSELNYHARYTLALARKDPALMKGVGSEELWIVAKVGSPVELRVYDSQGRVTGMLNGEVRSEIPNSSYYDNAVTILFPSDSYSYEVGGTGEGTYDLAVTTVAEQISTFTLSDVPTSANAVHQYTIDWETLATGKKGVTVKIDSDGDGTFEEVKRLGQEGLGFPWVWGVVVGLSALLGVLVGALMVWRRIGKKQGA